MGLASTTPFHLVCSTALKCYSKLGRGTKSVDPKRQPVMRYQWILKVCVSSKVLKFNFKTRYVFFTDPDIFICLQVFKMNEISLLRWNSNVLSQDQTIRIVMCDPGTNEFCKDKYPVEYEFLPANLYHLVRNSTQQFGISLFSTSSEVPRISWFAVVFEEDTKLLRRIVNLKVVPGLRDAIIQFSFYDEGSPGGSHDDVFVHFLNKENGSYKIHKVNLSEETTFEDQHHFYKLADLNECSQYEIKLSFDERQINNSIDCWTEFKTQKSPLVPWFYVSNRTTTTILIEWQEQLCRYDENNVFYTKILWGFNEITVSYKYKSHLITDLKPNTSYQIGLDICCSTGSLNECTGKAFSKNVSTKNQYINTVDIERKDRKIGILCIFITICIAFIGFFTILLYKIRLRSRRERISLILPEGLQWSSNQFQEEEESSKTTRETGEHFELKTIVRNND